jgi:hypothetical protein
MKESQLSGQGEESWVRERERVIWEREGGGREKGRRERKGEKGRERREERLTWEQPREEMCYPSCRGKGRTYGRFCQQAEPERWVNPRDLSLFKDFRQRILRITKTIQIPRKRSSTLGPTSPSNPSAPQQSKRDSLWWGAVSPNRYPSVEVRKRIKKEKNVGEWGN